MSEGTNAHAILDFLAAHPEFGFMPKEIHESTAVPRGSVSTTLRRLEVHGLVRHKGDYWAVTPDDRLAVIAGIGLSIDAVEERHGDDWYGRTPDWADELPDLDREDADRPETGRTRPETEDDG